MLRVSTAVAALFLLCVGAEAASYGAIAFSPDSGAYGYSTRRVSRANAQEWAMSYCDGKPLGLPHSGQLPRRLRCCRTRPQWRLGHQLGL
jgi:hypothetical protein